MLPATVGIMVVGPTIGVFTGGAAWIGGGHDSGDVAAWSAGGWASGDMAVLLATVLGLGAGLAALLLVTLLRDPGMMTAYVALGWAFWLPAMAGGVLVPWFLCTRTTPGLLSGIGLAVVSATASGFAGSGLRGLLRSARRRGG
ncbi:MAG: hypothetical protein KJO75_09565 [Dactylosporangium sp.]|nr:hypothetical protein [Dactylosporangium sp.]